MRVDCLAALRTQRMPTTRNEEYRFTDIGPILQLEPEVGHEASLFEQSLSFAQPIWTEEESMAITLLPVSALHADALETTVDT